MYLNCNRYNKDIDFYVPFVTGVVESGIHDYTAQELEIISRHKEYKRDVTHYGDPDVMKRNLIDKRSVFHVLRDKGIFINSRPWGGRKHRDIREKAKMLFRRLEVNYERNQEFIECMISAQYPRKAETSQSTSASDKPVHDWTSHFRSAFEYFADNEPFRKVTNTDLSKLKIRPKYKPLGGYT